jgi:hypothetical protein
VAPLAQAANTRWDPTAPRVETVPSKLPCISSTSNVMNTTEIDLSPFRSRRVRNGSVARLLECDQLVVEHDAARADAEFGQQLQAQLIARVVGSVVEGERPVRVTGPLRSPLGGQ